MRVILAGVCPGVLSEDLCNLVFMRKSEGVKTESEDGSVCVSQELVLENVNTQRGCFLSVEKSIQCHVG